VSPLGSIVIPGPAAAIAATSYKAHLMTLEAVIVDSASSIIA